MTVVLAICLITVFIRCQSNETPIQQLIVVVNGDSIEMVFVKGGTFMMGCTDEQGCDCEDPVSRDASFVTMQRTVINRSMRDCAHF